MSGKESVAPMKATKNTTFIDNGNPINLASGGVGLGELPWATIGGVGFDTA